jgi:diguanylate cyclase (GGDEF)-like protein/PAS domain S-box-containing protein
MLLPTRACQAAQDATCALHAVIEHVPTGIAVFDLCMRYVACSRLWRETYFGDVADVTGCGHYDLLPDLPEHWRDIHRRTLAGEVISAERDRYLRASGRVQWLRWLTLPWHDSKGEIAGIMIVTEDITGREQVQSQARLGQLIFAHATEGIAVTDANGHVLMANQAFQRLHGCSEAELVGLRLTESGPGKRAYQGLTLGAGWRGDVVLPSPDGDPAVERRSISAVQADDGTITHYICMATDVTAEHRALQQLRHLADYDGQTGLLRGPQFLARVEAAISAWPPTGEYPAVAFIDLDDFKTINDRFGHATGDAAISKVATLISAHTRAPGCAGRLGGDEFAILAPASEAHAIVADLLHALSRPLLVDGHLLCLSMSLGLSVYPSDGDTARSLLAQADSRMYVNKREKIAAVTQLKAAQI